MKKTTLEQFEKEFKEFVMNHQYFKDEETIVEDTANDPDEVSLEAHTVDGDYERIWIQIQYIS